MLPNWVKGRDGRLEPFDADAISAKLFAAAQTLGSADAFLVRELADGVLHFLDQEDLGDTTTNDAIADVAEKVVRELGHPALARSFAAVSPELPPSEPEPLHVSFSPADAPEDVARRSVTAFSLRSIFAADVAAACDQGLVHLHGLRSPRTLDAVVLEPARLGDRDPFDTAWNLVTVGAKLAGDRLVVDGPEWMFDDRPDAVANFVRGLDRSAQANDRRVDVHLNAAVPPPWAEPRGTGPLFADAPTAASSSRRWLAPLADAERVRLVWRWRDDPAIDAPFVEWLEHVRKACTVVFDRPRHPVSFGHGLSRRRQGILMRVGLDLPRLLNRPDVACQGDVFLEKLPSLARLAVSAGVQKRNSLRQHADHLSRGFLLDRAATCLEPVGFSTTLQQLMGVPRPTTKPARALASKILAALHGPLEEGRRRSGIEFLLDSPNFSTETETPHDVLLSLNDVARGTVSPDCLRLSLSSPQPNWSAILTAASRKTAVCAIHVEAAAASPAAAQQPGC